jgi:deoxyadenosine/deoxycytidine kinase
MHVDMGNISQDEWKVYENIVETTSSSLLEPTVIIYLEVDGEVAMERIKRRDRGDEKSSYTLDYLHELDISYKVSM